MKKDFWSVEWHQQGQQYGVDQLNLAHRPTDRVRNENVDLSAW